MAVTGVTMQECVVCALPSVTTVPCALPLTVPPSASCSDHSVKMLEGTGVLESVSAAERGSHCLPEVLSWTPGWSEESIWPRALDLGTLAQAMLSCDVM